MYGRSAGLPVTSKKSTGAPGSSTFLISSRAPEAEIYDPMNYAMARRVMTQNARTERCGRPSASAFGTDVARPRSLL